MEWLICPECGKYYRRLGQHCRRNHPDISASMILEKYPGTKKNPDELNEKYAEVARKAQLGSVKNFVITEARKAHYMKNLELNKDKNRLACSKHMSELNKTEAKRAEVSQRMRERMKDPEVLKQLATNGFGNKSYLDLPNGKSICVRSDLEKCVISTLINLGITDLDYECISIPYEVNGEIHNYIPDILIGKDLLIEVKPHSWRTTDRNIIKSNAAKSLGYKFYYASNETEVLEILKEQRLSKV